MTYNKIRVNVTALAIAAFTVTGCAIQTESSGFNRVPHPLPAGIPQRVAVSLSGPTGLVYQSEELLRTGLADLGFEVVPSAQAQGTFVGNVSFERAPTWTDTHLSLRLVEALDQHTLWSVNASDPRTFAVSMAPESSIIYTTKSALGALKRDLAKLP